ncbi:anti-phage protein KwaB [Pedobacter gandavensis]|uniref:anti-phage protein KwaB n=1 Tax=Pedobacter gandavensis TaxID=2679963 RepID=UPI0024792816|nr:anti-phage protein KwaB [Pedobacter gandavensis]WGQ11383.1 anti-phage protein KwaB [Pedobacter gandavensis]
MNKEELIEKLGYYLNPENGIGAALYFVLKDGEESTIKFANVEEDAKQELKERFLSYISDKFINNEDLHYQNISDADDRKNAVYKYDFEEIPGNLNILNEILANEEQPIFNFNHDNFSTLQGYLITIGNEANKIALYKKHHPVNLLTRDRFLLIPRNERLVKIENDAIAIDRSFDFMMIDDSLIVLKLGILERFFGFEDVVRTKAQNTIEQIAVNELLEDIEQLNGIVQNMTNARKLMRIKNSPVLNVPVANVINFIRNHPELTGKIGFNADETKINLTTHSSKKLFLKLLNDDYLFSELTELQYETHAKDKLKNEIQNENIA